MAGKINYISSLFRGILYGWIVGTAIGLMVVPNSGEDLRSMIQEKGDRVKERAVGTLMLARQQGEDLARRSTNQTSSLTEQGKTLINQQKIKVQSVIVGIREGVRVYVQSNGNGTTKPSQPTFRNTGLEA